MYIYIYIYVYIYIHTNRCTYLYWRFFLWGAIGSYSGTDVSFAQPLNLTFVEISSVGVPHTHRLLSSSFLGLPYRILNVNHKKELLRSLWVVIQTTFHRAFVVCEWGR